MEGGRVSNNNDGLRKEKKGFEKEKGLGEGAIGDKEKRGGRLKAWENEKRWGRIGSYAYI